MWPNYARDHAWMFAGTENVDAGVVDTDAAGNEGVRVGPLGEDMERVLEWAVGEIRACVGGVLVDGQGGDSGRRQD